MTLKNKVSVAVIRRYDYLFSDVPDWVSSGLAGIINSSALANDLQVWPCRRVWPQAWEVACELRWGSNRQQFFLSLRHNRSLIMLRLILTLLVKKAENVLGVARAI